MIALSIKALALIRQRPAASFFALALLACAIALGWLLIDRANLRTDLATAQAELAKVKDAQPAAHAAQAAANHQPAAVSATIAEISDAQASAYYERGRAAGAAYAAAHRVPASCPASQLGHADLPGADHPDPIDDGARQATDDVALSRADFEILTGNSLRLAQVYQDAQALIAAGIAVAPPEAPAP